MFQHILYLAATCALTVNLTVLFVRRLSTIQSFAHPVLHHPCYHPSVLLSVWLSVPRHSVSLHPTAPFHWVSKEISEVWVCWQDCGDEVAVPTCTGHLMDDNAVPQDYLDNLNSSLFHKQSHHSRGTRWVHWYFYWSYVTRNHCLHLANYFNCTAILGFSW